MTMTSSIVLFILYFMECTDKRLPFKTLRTNRFLDSK